MIMIIVNGDVNAKVGYKNRDFERVMRKQGLGLRYDNRESLYCEICDIKEPVIIGTLFPQKTI